VVLVCFYCETRPVAGTPHIGWFASGTLAVTALAAGWSLWHANKKKLGHGARLLGGLFFLNGLHGLDRFMWFMSPLYLERIAFDHLLAVALGIAMVVLVLEEARARTEELNDKLKRLSLL